MTRACLSILHALSLTIIGGCVLDEHLGDAATETATATAGDDGATQIGTQGNDDGGSISASSSPGSEGSDGPATGTDDSASDDSGDPTGEPGQTCSDWAAPPFDCELPAGATARVTGDFLPTLQDEPCSVVSVEPGAADEDTVTLDCGDAYVMQIATSSPHLDLPISGGEDVLVTAAGDSLATVIDDLVPSFVVRAPTGEILVAWVNAYGWDDVAFDVDIDPVVVSVTGSGCGTFFWNELCEGDGAIALQRSILQFGNDESPILVFDGNQAIAPAGAGDVSVIAETVETIVCWDDVCAGDDSGPFDRITFFLAALPSA